MIKKIKELIKSRKLRKQEKTELIAMIEDLDQKLKIDLNKVVASIEELSQEKLYFLYVDVDDKDLANIKQQFKMIKNMMRWSIPNILILNKPLVEISKERLKGLLKKIERGVKKQ